MSSIHGELLIKSQNMTDEERLNFFLDIHQWSGRQAQILHNVKTSEFLEIVKDDTENMEILNESQAQIPS